MNAQDEIAFILGRAVIAEVVARKEGEALRAALAEKEKASE